MPVPKPRCTGPQTGQWKPTFAEGFALVPGAVLDAADRGACGRLHEIARIALIAHGLVEGEVAPKLDAIG